MAASQLADLFKKVLDKTATAEERATLQQLLLEHSDEKEVQILFDNAFSHGPDEIKMDSSSRDEILEVIRFLDNNVERPKIVRLKRSFLRWSVAAAIIAIVLISAWLLVTSDTWTHKQGADVVLVSNDLKPPASSQAILTLSSGEKVLLDSLSTGKVTGEKGVQIVKGVNGQIDYSGNNQQVVINTITLPKGSRPFQLVLADGTSVWLNAASSISYPTAFTGKNRQVHLSGEAYFEVSHDALKPFLVQSDDVAIKVLGTHFNVKAYMDEPSTDITLLEGSVRVVNKDQEDAGVLLAPGQQAVVKNDIQLLKDIDTESVMAWKNGYFSLNGADLQSIMRQISRWYDVDVEYKGSFREIKFVGSISRDISLNELLQSLKEYGIEGKLQDQKLVLQMKQQ